MAEGKGVSHTGIWSYTGRLQPHLPPKSPIPNVTPSIMNYGSAQRTASRGIPKPREVQKQHHRASSESCLIEEQPSWLDDLLNEPETPIKKVGHRRSSSDSFAYFEGPVCFSCTDNISQLEPLYGDLPSMPLRGSLDFPWAKDDYHASVCSDVNSSGVLPENRRLGSIPNTLKLVNYKAGKTTRVSVGSESLTTRKSGASSAASEKQETKDSTQHEQKGPPEIGEGSQTMPSTEGEPKRIKQQFAQRSRVRKLQYIAELERIVQALQAEESEVSAELQFLDQQRLVLAIENKALRQQIDSIAQERAVKYLEQELLEREVQRLRMLLYQQQRCYDQQASSATSSDLSSRFAALSLAHSQGNANRDSLSGPLRI